VGLDRSPLASFAAAPIDRQAGNRASLAPQGLAAVLDLEVHKGKGDLSDSECDDCPSTQLDQKGDGVQI
jgi:hypothetical protein